MNINFFTASSAESTEQTSRLNADGTTSSAAAASTGHKVSDDTTALTSATDSVQQLAQQALASQAGRAAKVQNLKLSVQQGSYQLEPTQIALALVTAKV